MEQKEIKRFHWLAGVRLRVANHDADDMALEFIALAQKAVDELERLTAERDEARSMCQVSDAIARQYATERDELLSACEKAGELIGSMALAGSPWGSLTVLEQLHAAIAKATGGKQA